MISTILYELKSKKNNWLAACLLTVLAFAAAFAIMKLAPMIILYIVRFINRSEITLALFGLEKQLTSVTYKDLAISVITVANPVILYFVARNTAASYWYDKRIGNTFYFFTQPVSKAYYWFSKTFINLIFTLFLTLTAYLSVFLLSLSGVPVKELKKITVRQVNKIMPSFFMAVLTFCLLGIVLGLAVSEYRGLKLINYITIIMLLLCLLPNLTSALAIWLSSVNDSFESLSDIVPMLEKIRSFVPMYIH